MSMSPDNVFAVSTQLRHAALVLVVLGGLCLFGCVAMVMRTGGAEGSGEPIPDDPSADVLTKLGRGVARSERKWVPVYQLSWQVLLAVGLLLLVVAVWAFIGSFIGPIPAIVAAIALTWVTIVLFIRASQKATTVQTPRGQSYVLVMAPRGVPVVSARNRNKSWFRTPILVEEHVRQHYGEWVVSSHLVGELDIGESSTTEILSPRVEAAHRFRELARDIKRGQLPSPTEKT